MNSVCGQKLLDIGTDILLIAHTCFLFFVPGVLYASTGFRRRRFSLSWTRQTCPFLPIRSTCLSTSSRQVPVFGDRSAMASHLSTIAHKGRTKKPTQLRVGFLCINHWLMVWWRWRESNPRPKKSTMSFYKRSRRFCVTRRVAVDHATSAPSELSWAGLSASTS